MDAVILKHNIDNPLSSPIWSRSTRTVKFQRIDADVTDTFKEEVPRRMPLKETTDTLTDVFRKALDNDKLDGQGGEAEK